MGLQTGRRIMPRRRVYAAGARSGAKRLQETSERKYRRSTVKLIVCLVVFLILLAVKFIFPAGAEAVSRRITDGLDYKAAFSAIGKAITSGENIMDVFKGISLGGFNKGSDTDGRNGEDNAPGGARDDAKAGPADIAADADAVEAMSPVTILDEGDLTDGFSGSDAAGGIDGDDVPEEKGEDIYLEELLLRLPSSELEDQSKTSDDEIPENVSYDYYVIEFDYVTPLKGSMTSTFGYRIHPITKKRSFHYGVDIGASKGETVSAFSSGTIELTGYNSIYGNYLFIRHKEGIITFYGHLSKILVEEGQLVRMGEAVGRVGSTGLSTGPHLHFEIRNGDVILDPLHYVSPES